VACRCPAGPALLNSRSVAEYTLRRPQETRTPDTTGQAGLNRRRRRVAGRGGSPVHRPCTARAPPVLGVVGVSSVKVCHYFIRWSVVEARLPAGPFGYRNFARPLPIVSLQPAVNQLPVRCPVRRLGKWWPGSVPRFVCQRCCRVYKVFWHGILASSAGASFALFLEVSVGDRSQGASGCFCSASRQLCNGRRKHSLAGACI
jgi:hypothetical protein